MEQYFVKWDPAEITLAEAKLKIVYRVLETFNGSVIQSVDPVGSFLLRTTVHRSPLMLAHKKDACGDNTNCAMDLCVTIPESFCSQDDVQDGSYLEKRDSFLSQVQKHISNHLCRKADASALLNQLFAEDKPDELAAKAEVLQQCRMSIACCPFNNDLTKRFISVRFNMAESQHKSSVVGSQFGEVRVFFRPSTAPAKVSALKSIKKHPYYSYLVLEDFLMVEHMKRLHEMSTNSSVLMRAAVMLKVWANHVGLCGPSPESLNGFILTAMVLKLFQEGILSASMSEENLVRAAWVQMAKGFFLEEGVPMLRLQGQNINLLFRMSADFYDTELRLAADAAMRFTTVKDIFIELPFSPQLGRHDAAFFVELPKLEIQRSSGMSHSFISVIGERVSRIRDLVVEAMQNRASIVQVYHTSVTHVVVALSFASEADGRSRITRGPAIEEKELVAKFDNFWGTERTSARQFAEGGIFKCVMWGANIPASEVPPMSSILTEILTVVFHKHISKGANVSPLLSTLRGAISEHIGGGVWGDAVQVTEKSLQVAIDTVKKVVEAIPSGSLPVKLTAFDVISPCANTTEPFAIRPHFSLLSSNTDIPWGLAPPVPSLEPIHCVATIDDRGKIPDSSEAIEKMKGALVAQMKKAFLKAAQDTGGAKIYCFCSPAHLDVVFNGYLFRVHIGHYREVSLLKALGRTAEASLIERKLFWSARHALFVRGIARGHHSFCAAARLAKRWVGAMLLSDYIQPEVVELILAALYEGNYPPKTSEIAFFRFLLLLATFPWEKKVLALPLVKEDIAQANREIHPTAMWIATPYAPEESPFTLHTPKPMIMSRLVSTAQCAAVNLLRCLAATVPLHNVEASVFAIEEGDFDFVWRFDLPLVIHPDRCVATQRDAAFSPLAVRRVLQLHELANDEDRQKLVQQMAEMEPTSHCVRTLRASCRDSAMVFHDAVGPMQVGVILLASRPSKKQLERCQATLLKSCQGAFQQKPSSASTAISLPKAEQAAQPRKSGQKAQRESAAEKNVAVPEEEEQQRAEDVPKKKALRKEKKKHSPKK